MKQLIVVIVLCLSGVAVIGADEPEMDPLLELLVEQGVITEEQARAVEAEYKRREAAKAAAPELVISEEPLQTASTEVAPVPAVGEKKDEKWYDRIDVKGDLRLRYEGFWVDGLSDNDHRSRVRLRARPGIYTDITDWLDVGMQVRSGDPSDPVSDNQSTDGGFAMKQIAISEAFAGFDADWLYARVGKFDPKKLWKASDMQWDDDVTVEGALEQFEFGAFESSLYQYFLEERKGGDDSLLLGGQLRGNFDLSSKHSLMIGAGYDDWINPQYVADLTLSGKLRGNRITNLLTDDDMLVSDFEIGSVFGEWTYEMNERWPIKVSAFAYHNFGAQDLGKDYDDAYFVRFQIGDYKKKGQVALRASRYYSEPDALFYVFTQSDTTMVSDVDGYRFDLRLGWVMKSYFNFTWYHTDPASGLQDVETMNRLQLDYIIRF